MVGNTPYKLYMRNCRRCTKIYRTKYRRGKCCDNCFITTQRNRLCNLKKH